MNTDEHRSDDPLTRAILGACFEVSNTLGCGFLEHVYHNALLIELRQGGYLVESKRRLPVSYKGELVGEYEADIIVEDKVIIDVKAVKGLDSVHVAQCMNYLKATGIRVALLVNFGTPKVQYQRIVC